MPDAPARHDRVWLVDEWRNHQRSALSPDHERTITAWLSAGRPLVAARRGCDDGPDDLRLGLALPGKGRVGLHIDRKALGRIEPPLLLADAVQTAPQSWRSRLMRLDTDLRAHGMAPRVFGSLAWHCTVAAANAGAATGYISARSDIDLLVAPGTVADLWTACRILERNDDEEPRIDGELVLPDGGAVAWRECASAASEVLVKSITGVALVPLCSLAVTFEGLAA